MFKRKKENQKHINACFLAIKRRRMLEAEEFLAEKKRKEEESKRAQRDNTSP